jgi:two-component system, NtrC family, nitrogen regulation response regulator GlnG
MALYELLHQQIKRMITGIGRNNRGNIHPLVMHEIEKYIINIVLEETNHNYVVASKMLGIGRSTLYRKIKEFGLEHTPIMPPD